MDARKPEPISSLVRAKVERLRAGGSPGVLDLFSGCGGFSLGFRLAQCNILGGVEIDPDAAASHELNFHHGLDAGPLPLDREYARDVTQMCGSDRLVELQHPRGEEVVDFLIGGPPCPAFARVGRAKLREVRQHDQAFLNDERARLFEPYLQWVAELSPVAVVMENVPDIMNYGGVNIAELICERLEALDYVPMYTLLNAANYGVPQMRDRLILIALHKEAGAQPVFPAPTHHVVLPGGYHGTRHVAFKPFAQKTSRHYRIPPSQDHLDPVRDRAVSVRDALGDLPPITAHLEGTLARGRRHLDRPVPCAQAASDWAIEHVRASPPGDGGVTAHVIRSLSHRDYRLFARMSPGDEYPAAYDQALALFRDFLGDVHAVGAQLPDDLASSTELSRLLNRAVLFEAGLSAGMIERAGRLVDQVGAARRQTWEAVAPLSERWPGIVEPPSITEAWNNFLAVHGMSVPPLSVERLRGTLQLCAAEAGRLRRWVDKREAWSGSLVHLGLTEEPTHLDLEAYPPDLQKSDIEAAIQSVEAGTASSLLLPGPAAHALSLARRIRLAAVSHRIGLFLHFKDGFVPPYDPTKFPNKWRKMAGDEPARTLMAHLGKDSYSHIHYDDAQARTISVREAARLQSFPDSFQFHGSMNAGFRQVGNAVPPLFARRIAEVLVATVRSGTQE